LWRVVNAKAEALTYLRSKGVVAVAERFERLGLCGRYQGFFDKLRTGSSIAELTMVL